MRRRPKVGLRSACGLALVVGALLGVAGASGADQPASGAAGWESLLGDRPLAQLGGRWVVVLAAPSLATRVAAAGGVATEEQERTWTAAARQAQREVIAGLVFRGVPIDAEYSFTRTFNGFSTPLDARGLAIVARNPDVRGVYPVRAAFPAAVEPEQIEDIFGIRGPAPGDRHPRLLGCRCHRRTARHRRRSRPPLHPGCARAGL